MCSGSQSVGEILRDLLSVQPVNYSACLLALGRVRKKIRANFSLVGIPIRLRVRIQKKNFFTILTECRETFSMAYGPQKEWESRPE